MRYNTETKLTANDKITIRGFRVERSDRDNSGRGATRQAKRPLQKADTEISRIEHVIVELENGVLISDSYAPPPPPNFVLRCGRLGALPSLSFYACC